MTGSKETNDLLRKLQEESKSNFQTLKKLIEDQKSEIKRLNTMVLEKDKKIVKLEDDLNQAKKQIQNGLHERELRDRMNSVRIFGLKLDGEPTNVGNVLENVYSKLIFPILDQAVTAGDIDAVPPCHALLEYGHILPSKKADSPTTPPIIVRFFSRHYRYLVFKHKRSYLHPNPVPPSRPPQTRSSANSAAATPAVAFSSPERSPIYINEDLTSATFKKMKDMIEDKQTYSKVWTVNGRIKFVLKSAPNTVSTVRNVFALN